MLKKLKALLGFTDHGGGDATGDAAGDSASRDQIRRALARLMERSNDDAFVIFENPENGKFVQFAGGVGQELCFDLPMQTLSSEEAKRANAVLLDYGIGLEEWEVLDRPGGQVAGTQSGFNASLGQDIDQGAEIAWRVFSEVYQLKGGVSIGIVEN